MITLGFSTLVALIKKARALELQHDWDAVANLFKNFGIDFSDPNTEGLPLVIEAELLRLFGHSLVGSGRAKSKKDLQELGKNFLTRAIDKFEVIANPKGIIESKCQLALSYCYDGRPAEAVDILSEAEKQCPANDNTLFLQIKVNHIIALNYLERFEESFESIKSIWTEIEFCENKFIAAAFYNQSGYTFNCLNDPDLAIASYKSALFFAKEIKNRRVIGQTSNNLAYTFHKQKKLKDALFYIKEAEIMAVSCDDKGWLANYLDTKALIELELGDYASALKNSTKSLKLLIETDDLMSLMECHWTKIKILAALDDLLECQETYAALHKLTETNYGQSEARKQTARFCEIVNFRIVPVPDIKSVIPNGFAASFAESATGQIKVFPPVYQLEDLNFCFNLEDSDHIHAFFYVPAEHAHLLGCDYDVICMTDLAKTKRDPRIVRLIESDTFELCNVGVFSLGDEMLMLKTANENEPILVYLHEVENYGAVVRVANAKGFETGFLNFNTLNKVTV